MKLVFIAGQKGAGKTTILQHALEGLKQQGVKVYETNFRSTLRSVERMLDADPSDKACFACDCPSEEVLALLRSKTDHPGHAIVVLDAPDDYAALLRDAMRWRHGESHSFPDSWQQTHPVVLPPYWIADGIDTKFPSAGEAVDAHMTAVAKKGGAA